ncbi:MAG: glycoside hydrolase family 95 protein [Tannerellaceae bacterium]|jgi:alpha-L-fucosidase 2|nr:glycoside hydrolase family 95 protein [Tannerellaceae bacterium]
MKQQFSIKNLFIVLLITVAFMPVCFANNNELRKDMLLWYNTKPDGARVDPLPLGNGFIGALVYGKVNDERIALNESSFWSGRPHDYNDPDAGKYFGQIKDLVFDGKFKEAERIADHSFYGKPIAQQAYQPLGDLRLMFYGIDDYETTQYYRDLDMETGVTSVSFVYEGVKYTREVFVSYPDRVMVIRITADKPGAISFDLSLNSHFTDKVTVEPGKIVLDGTWESTIPKYWLIGNADGKGMSFQTVVQAKADGGQSSVHKDRLTIRNADSATLILSAATSFVNYNDISGDPAARNQKTLADVDGKDYASLRQRHIDDFSGLMGKVHLNIGDKAKNEKPIDQRIQDANGGEQDAGLEALCFQFGRYMLVSSSRPGGQPSNLQGIWNEKPAPPWGSKYTININTQMNYWPAEVTNLSECHLPLISMVKDLSETGEKTARIYYGAKGWVTHHNVDLWRGAAPVDGARFGMWPLGGAWLCQHLWEHYAFSGDKDILKEIYPILKGSAEFLSGILVEYPKYGYLVTPFSMSPEHGYYFDESNVLAYLSPAPTMDVGIMRELFPHVIEASRILGVDATFRKKLESILPKLPPYKVNQLGYVREWVEDWRPQRGGHDVSPYFPFYPGKSVLLRRESDTEIVNAYRYWLESRGLRGGGFPGSWNICMWARMERGDRAGALIQAAATSVAGNILRQGTGSQVDAPFGFTAGVAESLIQSHAGEISLLPALPVGWALTGEVSGLRARGGYEVSMRWEKGKLLSARISNPDGGVCNVRYNGKVSKITVPVGQTISISDAASK